jgi:hypothetical protein
MGASIESYDATARTADTLFFGVDVMVVAESYA